VTQPTFAPFRSPVKSARPSPPPRRACAHPESGPAAFTRSAERTRVRHAAPGEGYALTIAHHVLSTFSFENEHDRDDVELAIGLVAAKRASLVGRGPIPGDVHVALHHFGIEGTVVTTPNVWSSRAWRTVTSPSDDSSTRSRLVNSCPATRLISPHD